MFGSVRQERTGGHLPWLAHSSCRCENKESPVTGSTTKRTFETRAGMLLDPGDPQRGMASAQPALARSQVAPSEWWTLASPRTSPPSTPDLGDLLEQLDTGRAVSILDLVGHEHEDAARSALEERLQAADNATRCTAATLLGMMGGSGTLRALRECWHSTTQAPPTSSGFAFQTALARALLQLDPDASEVADVVASWFRDDDKLRSAVQTVRDVWRPELCTRAMRTLSRALGGSIEAVRPRTFAAGVHEFYELDRVRTLRRVEQLFRGENCDTRRWAVRAAANLQHRCSRARELLEEWLHTETSRELLMDAIAWGVGVPASRAANTVRETLALASPHDRLLAATSLTALPHELAREIAATAVVDEPDPHVLGILKQFAAP